MDKGGREEVGEECGVAGIYLKKRNFGIENVPSLLEAELLELRHRGQLSSGISVFNPFNKGYEKRLKVFKEVCSIDNLFDSDENYSRKELMKHHRGIAGIGHVRYATSGSAGGYFNQYDEAQPFMRHHGRPWKRFTISFNGNLANYSDLRRDMLKEGYIIDTRVDTELIMHLIALSMKDISESRGKGDRGPDFFEVSKRVMEKLDGAYNVLMMFADGTLAAWRDPHGFKPLVWGENENYFGIASESVALEKVGIRNFKDVEPGSCMLFNGREVLEKKLLFTRRAHCQFEKVYFAKATSVADGKSVNSARERLGERLAEDEPLAGEIERNREDYVVVPIPDTAIPSTEAYAKVKKLRWSMAIIKNEGKRGFINKEEVRYRIMDFKYGLIGGRVKDKKVIVVEDSIIRGDTGKRVVKMLRGAGALEVHFRSTCPPIKHPCFYGIDFPSYDELIASGCNNLRRLERDVAMEIGADSVHYQTISGLVGALECSESELCLACLNGEYSTPAGKRNAEIARRRFEKKRNFRRGDRV